MSKAAVLTGYGDPDVLAWADVAIPEPGPGQVRIRVQAAGVSPTDLKIRRGHLQAVFPLPPHGVLGFEAAGTVDALGPDVTGVAIGDEIAALLPRLGGYAEYALASAWAPKPAAVSWSDAAALPASAEAAVGVLKELHVSPGETILIMGGAGSVGIVAVQLALAQGLTVISSAGGHDQDLLQELGAIPVRYGPDLLPQVKAHAPRVDAVLDAAGHGGLADAITLAGGPARVLTLADEHAADFGVALSKPTPDRAPEALRETMPLLASGRMRLRDQLLLPMQNAAEAHALLENGAIRKKLVLTTD